eukprot:TRINITY_DN7690_c0_g1_i1.p1 TRINITY_DN7690_c0_g1~~TRINITY_DN7690_c0_g1_i1.p1  ORF type:complete len:1693 (+),score=493.77 TRINITY_DN7690_c0_g1_i1:82-5079(+)
MGRRRGAAAAVLCLPALAAGASVSVADIPWDGGLRGLPGAARGRPELIVSVPAPAGNASAPAVAVLVAAGAAGSAARRLEAVGEAAALLPLNRSGISASAAAPLNCSAGQCAWAYDGVAVGVVVAGAAAERGVRLTQLPLCLPIRIAVAGPNSTEDSPAVGVDVQLGECAATLGGFTLLWAAVAWAVAAAAVGALARSDLRLLARWRQQAEQDARRLSLAAAAKVPAALAAVAGAVASAAAAAVSDDEAEGAAEAAPPPGEEGLGGSGAVSVHVGHASAEPPKGGAKVPWWNPLQWHLLQTDWWLPATAHGAGAPPLLRSRHATHIVAVLLGLPLLLATWLPLLLGPGGLDAVTLPRDWALGFRVLPIAAAVAALALIPVALAETALHLPVAAELLDWLALLAGSTERPAGLQPPSDLGDLWTLLCGDRTVGPLVRPRVAGPALPLHRASATPAPPPPPSAAPPPPPERLPAAPALRRQPSSDTPSGGAKQRVRVLAPAEAAAPAPAEEQADGGAAQGRGRRISYRDFAFPVSPAEPDGAPGADSFDHGTPAVGPASMSPARAPSGGSHPSTGRGSRDSGAPLLESPGGGGGVVEGYAEASMPPPASQRRFVVPRTRGGWFSGSDDDGDGASEEDEDSESGQADPRIAQRFLARRRRGEAALGAALAAERLQELLLRQRHDRARRQQPPPDRVLWHDSPLPYAGGGPLYGRRAVAPPAGPERAASQPSWFLDRMRREAQDLRDAADGAAQFGWFGVQYEPYGARGRDRPQAISAPAGGGGGAQQLAELLARRKEEREAQLFPMPGEHVDPRGRRGSDLRRGNGSKLPADASGESGGTGSDQGSYSEPVPASLEEEIQALEAELSGKRGRLGALCLANLPVAAAAAVAWQAAEARRVLWVQLLEGRRVSQIPSILRPRVAPAECMYSLVTAAAGLAAWAAAPLAAPGALVGGLRGLVLAPDAVPAEAAIAVALVGAALRRRSCPLHLGSLDRVLFFGTARSCRAAEALARGRWHDAAPLLAVSAEDGEAVAAARAVPCALVVCDIRALAGSGGGAVCELIIASGAPLCCVVPGDEPAARSAEAALQQLSPPLTPDITVSDTLVHCVRCDAAAVRLRDAGGHFALGEAARALFRPTAGWRRVSDGDRAQLVGALARYRAAMGEDYAARFGLAAEAGAYTFTQIAAAPGLTSFFSGIGPASGADRAARAAAAALAGAAAVAGALRAIGRARRAAARARATAQAATGAAVAAATVTTEGIWRSLHATVGASGAAAVVAAAVAVQGLPDWLAAAEERRQSLAEDTLPQPLLPRSEAEPPAPRAPRSVALRRGGTAPVRYGETAGARFYGGAAACAAAAPLRPHARLGGRALVLLATVVGAAVAAAFRLTWAQRSLAALVLLGGPVWAAFWPMVLPLHAAVLLWELSVAAQLGVLFSEVQGWAAWEAAWLAAGGLLCVAALQLAKAAHSRPAAVALAAVAVAHDSRAFGAPGGAAAAAGLGLAAAVCFRRGFGSAALFAVGALHAGAWDAAAAGLDPPESVRGLSPRAATAVMLALALYGAVRLRGARCRFVAPLCVSEREALLIAAAFLVVLLWGLVHAAHDDWSSLPSIDAVLIIWSEACVLLMGADALRRRRTLSHAVEHRLMVPLSDTAGGLHNYWDALRGVVAMAF